MPNQYGPDIQHNPEIEKHVRRGIRNGVALQVILDSVQHMNFAPRSMNTLKKYYGQAIAEERAELHNFIGEAVRDGIERKSDKLIEFAARAKANWNPTTKVEAVNPDDPDENKDALSVLAEKLGRVLPEKEDEE